MKSKQKQSIIVILRMLAYLLALVSFVVLALTGFYPVLILGEHISGYLVMLHVTFAPVLTVCVAVLAVMWASNCRFTAGDWPWFERIVKRITSVKGVDKTAKSKSSGLGQKITFWLIIFLTLPLALSIVISMFHFFGTHGQKSLLGLHRNIAYIFTVVVVVHTFLLMRSTAKK
ncbi:MAG: cytochrome b/b6 domain-containing protein [Planctomycetota bacterium]|jgi:cytochrome b subunit of formate dehydrogenase